MKALLCALVLAALCACGGGDPEPECVYNAQATKAELEQPLWVARCEHHD
jgi:hypothetical protein